MRTVNDLKKIISELEDLDIQYKIVNAYRIEFLVFNLPHSIECGVQEDNYTLEYVGSNGETYRYTDQNWSKVLDNTKLGISMYFERIKENSLVGSKYYQKTPNYTPYNVFGDQSHRKLQDALRTVGEQKKVIKNLHEENESLKKGERELGKIIARLRDELSRYQENDEEYQQYKESKGIQSHSVIPYSSLEDGER